MNNLNLEEEIRYEITDESEEAYYPLYILKDHIVFYYPQYSKKEILEICKTIILKMISENLIEIVYMEKKSESDYLICSAFFIFDYNESNEVLNNVKLWENNDIYKNYYIVRKGSFNEKAKKLTQHILPAN